MTGRITLCVNCDLTSSVEDHEYTLSFWQLFYEKGVHIQNIVTPSGVWFYYVLWLVHHQLRWQQYMSKQHQTSQRTRDFHSCDSRFSYIHRLYVLGPCYVFFPKQIIDVVKIVKFRLIWVELKDFTQSSWACENCHFLLPNLDTRLLNCNYSIFQNVLVLNL